MISDLARAEPTAVALDALLLEAKLLVPDRARGS